MASPIDAISTGHRNGSYPSSNDQRGGLILLLSVLRPAPSDYGRGRAEVEGLPGSTFVDCRTWLTEQQSTPHHNPKGAQGQSSLLTPAAGQPLAHPTPPPHTLNVPRDLSAPSSFTGKIVGISFKKGY